MRDQFDNYEKRIMEKLDREAEEIERRIKENPQVEEAKPSEGLDRKVYDGVAAYEKAAAGKREPDTDLENPAGLSPEDMEALRLGRELQRRLREEESKEEPEKAKRKYTGMWKRFVAAAAVLALAAGFGVNSVGGPTRIVDIMKQAVGGREMSQGNSSVNDAKISGKDTEEEAYQQIKDELGIDPVRVVVIDNNMKYKNCEIDPEIRTAQVLYTCGDKNISYLIGDSYAEELWSSGIEDEKIDEYVYPIDGVNIVVTEYRLPESALKRYSAEFEYKKIYYQLTGTVEKLEFENILKNLHFS